MKIEFKTILFTSNLSETSRVAFNHAAFLARNLNTKMILLHVIEIPTMSYENLLIKLFGKEKMKNILEQNYEKAQNILIGKFTNQLMARTALDQFCLEAGIGNEQCGSFDYKIVVKDGNVVETIIQQAAEGSCDMIVMGASQGIITGTTLGGNVKAVLDKARIPVLVISSAGHQK